MLLAIERDIRSARLYWACNVSRELRTNRRTLRRPSSANEPMRREAIGRFSRLQRKTDRLSATKVRNHSLMSVSDIKPSCEVDQAFFSKCSNVLLLQKTDKTSPGRLKNLLQDVDMNCLSAAACRRRAKRVSSAYFASNSSNVDSRVAAPGASSHHLYRKITSPAAHCHPVSWWLWLIKVLNVIAHVTKYCYNQIYMYKLLVCLGKLVNANKESAQQLGNIHRCAAKCQW